MSSRVFLNVLAYAGIGFVTVSLFYLGLLLLRPNSAVRGLAAMIGESRAREIIRDGRLRTGQIRVIGTIFLLLGGFIAFCIARDIQHV